MIKELFLERIGEEKKSLQGYIRASSIGYCPIAIAMGLKGEEPSVSDKQLCIFELGNAIHLNFQDKLKDVLVDVEREYKDDELKIVGHIDGRLKDDNIIVEFKSISPFAMRKSTLPYEHHIDQVHAYMYLSKTEKAIIVYINKNSGDIFEYEVSFDKERWNKIVEKIKYIQKIVEENTDLATIDIDIEDWQCKYCLYSGKCPVF